MNEQLLKSLLKKAMGYKVTEVSEEYSVNSEGEEFLSKRKLTKKYVPPDMTALKTYLELTKKDQDYNSMTDEELEVIRKKLIKELKSKNKNLKEQK